MLTLPNCVLTLHVVLRVHTGYGGFVVAVVEEGAAKRYRQLTGDGFLKCTTPYGVFTVHVSCSVPLPDENEELGYCNAAVSPAKGALTPETVVYYVRFQKQPAAFAPVDRQQQPYFTTTDSVTVSLCLSCPRPASA